MTRAHVSREVYWRTGADEYVGKPYDAAYVVSRARELVRRAPDAHGLGSILVIEDSPTFQDVLRAALEAERNELPWLSSRLAPYQNPRYIAVVDDFERTASQRIMKHKLSPRLDDCWDRMAAGGR